MSTHAKPPLLDESPVEPTEVVVPLDPAPSLVDASPSVVSLAVDPVDPVDPADPVVPVDPADPVDSPPLPASSVPTLDELSKVLVEPVLDDAAPLVVVVASELVWLELAPVSPVVDNPVVPLVPDDSSNPSATPDVEA